MFVAENTEQLREHAGSRTLSNHGFFFRCSLTTTHFSGVDFSVFENWREDLWRVLGVTFADIYTTSSAKPPEYLKLGIRLRAAVIETIHFKEGSEMETV